MDLHHHSAFPEPAHPAMVQAPHYSSPICKVEPPYSENSASGLFNYWRMLNRHKIAIILTSIGGLLVGFGVGIPMKPVYRTSTSIEVLNLNEDFMNMKQANPVSTNDLSYDVSEAQTQTKLLESGSLLNRVILKLDPAGYKAVSKPKLATMGWRNMVHLREPVQISSRESQLNNIAGTLKVHITARTRVIEASVESTDPQLAAEFANTLIQEFIQQSLETRYASTHDTSNWLGHEIEDARSNLKRSEDELQAYARVSGLIFTDNNNVSIDKLQQVQQQLSSAAADRIAKQARCELAHRSPPGTLADVLSDVGLKDITAKINDSRRQIADLSAVYNPEYNKIKRALAELAALEGAFELSRANVLKRIDNDYQEATTKEKLLAAAYNTQVQEVSRQDQKAIQYNILKREVDSNRQLYDTMLQQTKQSSIASALRASNVRVIDPAFVPDSPFSPNFKWNSVVGLFVGLFLSVAIVTIREQRDRRLHQPGDIELWTSLAELGTIPSAAAAVKRADDRLTVSPYVSLNGKQKPLSLNGARRVELITWQQKPSFVAESFRSALASILFIGENGSCPRVLVFTSANAADGKTTVVSNLAIATAELGRKALVIDADLRQPRMHQIFDVPNDRGLSDLLSDELSVENPTCLIRPTTIPNLHVLPVGPRHSTVRLLYSHNFTSLLTKLKEEYDLVLIDTPPMLQMTDARVAGRLSDAVVLVARSGQTTRDSILAIKYRLGQDSIRILGTILNDWDPEKTPSDLH